jgi:hypothetical protein
MLEKFKKRNLVVLDSKEQSTVKDKPSSVDREARLSVANNRMFIVVVVMGLVTLFAVYAQHAASVRADNTIKTAWVKMYPDGTWDVEFNDEKRQPDFFQSTIDYILRNWSKRRYSKIPSSVNSDYGFCYTFLSPALQNDFVSPDGFNAPAAAAKISECNNCPVTKIKVRNIDHYDSDKTKFGKFDGTLYRTNVFATRETRAADGTLNGTENIIIPIQWRIKSKEEIQAEKDLLKTNPIGLEIIEYDLLIDTATKNQKKGGQKQ